MLFEGCLQGYLRLSCFEGCLKAFLGVPMFLLKRELVGNYRAPIFLLWAFLL